MANNLSIQEQVGLIIKEVAMRHLKPIDKEVQTSFDRFYKWAGENDVRYESVGLIADVVGEITNNDKTEIMKATKSPKLMTKLVQKIKKECLAWTDKYEYLATKKEEISSPEFIPCVTNYLLAMAGQY